MIDKQPILAIANLTVSMKTNAGDAILLDDIALTIGEGEIMGLVGESGCGKTSLVKAILRILPDNATIVRGRLALDGEDILAMDERAVERRVRGAKIGFVPQDPFLSLNPLFRVGEQILEIMRWRGPDAGWGRNRRNEESLERLVASMQIRDPRGALRKFPHQLSGGQRQRLLIAGALSCGQKLVIADEPTSALDVTTQRQILSLFRDRARERASAILLVTHDIGLVAQFCDRVAVMYAGQLVEQGPTEEVLNRPLHPYTARLIACHPDRSGALVGIEGVVPPLSAMPSGCRFHPRCSQKRPDCERATPAASRRRRSVVRCALYSPSDEDARQNV